MSQFTPLSALAGGLLIGLGAVVLMVCLGRIAGVSGILGGLLRGEIGDADWRAAFVGGLVAGPFVVATVQGRLPEITIDSSMAVLIVAGVLVGIGTVLGNGCTSGHGVCGLARGSVRSLAATVIFMSIAVAVVFLRRHVLGG